MLCALHVIDVIDTIDAIQIMRKEKTKWYNIIVINEHKVHKNKK
jgi:hypothetical protein